MKLIDIECTKAMIIRLIGYVVMHTTMYIFSVHLLALQDINRQCLYSTSALLPIAYYCAILRPIVRRRKGGENNNKNKEYK